MHRLPTLQLGSALHRGLQPMLVAKIMEMDVDRVILGDCTEVLKGYPENSIDCIVTDPPYGLNFMGKAWDKALPPRAAFVEMCRVLKPGALAFVMSSPRQDLMWRMGQLLEESGFELGQSFISWVYASGFPKALDISKMIDKRNNKKPEDFIELGKYIKAKRIELGLNQGDIAVYFPSKTGGITGCVVNWEKGYNTPTKPQWTILKEKLGLDNRFDFIIEREEAEREKIGKGKSHISFEGPDNSWNSGYKINYDLTKPSLPEAKQWSGWKSVTGLKPALEIVFMVQKPLTEKTIVDNVLRWGTGAMNVNAARIPIGNGEPVDLECNRVAPKSDDSKMGLFKENGRMATVTSQGRFPANLICSNNALNDGEIHKSGDLKPWHNLAKDKEGYQVKNNYGKLKRQVEDRDGDSGSFSRYFDLEAWSRHNGFLNVPKAGTGEREYGLYLGEKKDPKSKFNLSNGSGERFDGGKLNKRRNSHPCVKPVQLMAYLIELGCPPGGVVLDPFAGSGTTCVAAKKLGRRFIGIEIDEASHRIAVARVNAEPISLDQFNVV